MKQIQFEYQERESFLERLRAFREDSAAAGGARLFQIYSEVLDPAVIQDVTGAIEEYFPDTPYIGCSTSGNIIDCELSGNITVVCTDFELPTTKFEIFQYDMA